MAKSIHRLAPPKGGFRAPTLSTFAKAMEDKKLLRQRAAKRKGGVRKGLSA